MEPNHKAAAALRPRTPRVALCSASRSSSSWTKRITIRNTDDAFDHYTMRQLEIQFAGTGKARRTVLMNVDTVAKDLRTSPECASDLSSVDVLVLTRSIRACRSNYLFCA